MEVLVILVPLALGLGLVGLLGFLWSLKSGQYDDLEGAAWRAIADDDPARSDYGVAVGLLPFIESNGRAAGPPVDHRNPVNKRR